MARIYQCKRFKKPIACSTCQVTHLCLPKGFSHSELADFNTIIESAYMLECGESIVNPGEELRYLYAIRTGSFKQYSIDPEGKERIIDFYLPGEIIGLDAISTSQYHYSIIALEQSTVCRIAFKNLLASAQCSSNLQQSLLSLISQKLLDRTFINNHQQAQQRLAAFLVGLSKRFEAIGCPSTHYQLSMSRHDIGNYLNLTTETVSRTLSKFKSKGLIAVSKKHISLNKPKALSALAV